MSDRSRDSVHAEEKKTASRNGGQRLHVTFVTTSYPAAGDPRANIFTHRALKVLSSEVDAQVIEFCSWKRGRQPFVSNREYDDVRVISFACPRIPLQKASHINALIQAHFGKYVLRSFLKNTDLVHATSLYSPGFVAGQWAKSVRKPSTSHAIGSDVNFLLPRAQKSLFFRRWHLDGIACESEDMRRKVASFFPAARNVRVMYRGVDIEKFSPLDIQNDKSFPHTPLRFLFLGGFHSWNANDPFYNVKGGPIMLQSWQQIERQITPDVLVVGGPRIDTYREYLENWRASLARPDAVSFLPALHPDAIPGVIREADVVVIPSLFEGLPNVAKEAQACGRPVLGTNAGGIPEAVLHEKTGIIVPQGNVDALASGFLWFHVNKDRLETLSVNARNHILLRFSWKSFSTNMMDFFRTAIAIHTSES